MRVDLSVPARQNMLVTDLFVDFCGATSEHEGAFNTSQKRESQQLPRSNPLRRPSIISLPMLTYTLPDLLANFPWPRSLSEHYKEAKADSSAWTESYHLFDEEGLKGFNLCDFSV